MARVRPRRQPGPALRLCALALLLGGLGLAAVPLRAAGSAPPHEAPAKGDAKADAKVHSKAPPKTEPKAEPKADAAAHAQGKTQARAAPDAAAAAASDLDRLRERLAEKLGATAPQQGQRSGVVRVSAPLQSPVAATETVHAAPASGHGVRRPSASAAHGPAAEKPAPAHRHWGYAGEGGPAAWAQLEPEFATCAKGQRQSPIDIRGGIAVDLEPVRFDYRPSTFGVLDNGHTIQANVGPGNSIAVSGRRFELQQLHFHRPAEERIDGRSFDMSLHLVHKDGDGRLAVVALLLERGDAPQPVVQRVWNDLPLEKGMEQPASQPLDLAALLPAERGYYTYMGSLTTPPCSEGVLWMVMRQPVVVSQAQIDVFARLYPMNARPLQSAAGRLIKQSQ